MDGLHAVLKWADHNRFLAGLLVVALLGVLAFAGCEPTTPSVLRPGEKVTTSQLQSEAAQIDADYEAKAKQLEIAYTDLQSQYAKRQQIVGIIGALGQAAATGGLNPAAGVAGAIQVLTLAAAGGLALDNRRKDKQISAAKTAKSAKT